MTDPPSPHHTLADKQTYSKWARGPRLREAHSDDRGLLLEAARPESKLLVRCGNQASPPLAGLLLVMIKRTRKKEEEEKKPKKKIRE